MITFIFLFFNFILLISNFYKENKKTFNAKSPLIQAFDDINTFAEKKDKKTVDFFYLPAIIDNCRSDERPACGSVAQLVRVPACHAGGREFESLLSRIKKGES